MFHLENKKFGRLTVLHRDQNPTNNKKKYVKWVCQCECGNIVSVVSSDLVNGHTKSCGCYHKDMAKKSLTTIRSKNHHFHQTKTKIYRIWHGMMNRCYNPKFKFYKYYGGRGIVVCKEWHDFYRFKKDMGDVQNGMTIDRIDPNKGYSKDNCRWASMCEQNNNRRSNIFIQYNNEKLTAKQFSKKYSIDYQKTLKLIHLKFSAEEILNRLKYNTSCFQLF